MSLCPFGRLPKDCSNIELDVEQKVWFGTEINEGRKTASALSEVYNLPRKLLTRYADKVRKGLSLHDRGGRPNILSPAEKENVFNYVSQPGVDKRLPEIQNDIVKMRKDAAKASNQTTVGIGNLSDRTFRRVMKEMSISQHAKQSFRYNL